jgi:flagellin-like protein
MGKTRKINISRKGVSPLIATVLLIALTIAAFLAIFAWSKGFIKEQVEKNGQLVDTQCQSIAFDAIMQGNTVYVTNKGNVVVYGFNIRGEKDGTTKLFFLRTESGKLGIGEVDNLDLSSVPTIGDYSKISLIPVLLGRGTNSGTGKLFTCPQEKVIKGS